MQELTLDNTKQASFSKKRCVGYVRVSTQEQAEEGYSIDAQIQTIQEYCQRETWNALECTSIEARAGRILKGARRCSNFFRMRKVVSSMP